MGAGDKHVEERDVLGEDPDAHTSITQVHLSQKDQDKCRIGIDDIGE